MNSDEKNENLLRFRDEIVDKNFYEILGIAPQEASLMARKAYFNLLKRYGADHFLGETDPAILEALDVVNKKIREAYETLSDDNKRQAYDTTLKNGTASEAAAIDMADVFASDRAMSQARGLMERGNFKIAAQKLESVLTMDPHNDDVRARLAYSRYMMMNVDANGKRNPQQVQSCRQILIEATEALPRADDLRTFLGILEKIEGNDSEAQRLFREAVAINPGNAAAKRELHLFSTRSRKKTDANKKPMTTWEKIKEFLTKKR